MAPLIGEGPLSGPFTETVQPDAAAGVDAYVAASHSTSNFGTSTVLATGRTCKTCSNCSACGSFSCNCQTCCNSCANCSACGSFSCNCCCCGSGCTCICTQCQTCTCNGCGCSNGCAQCCSCGCGCSAGNCSCPQRCCSTCCNTCSSCSACGSFSCNCQTCCNSCSSCSACGWNGVYYSYVQFDDLGIPDDAIITSATLTLTRISGSTGNTIKVGRVTSDWTEGAVTYNTRPTADLFRTHTVVSGANAIDVTDIVEDWIAGGANRGFAVLPNSDTDSETDYASSDHGTAASRPKLAIEYQLPWRGFGNPL